MYVGHFLVGTTTSTWYFVKFVSNTENTNYTINIVNLQTKDAALLLHSILVVVVVVVYLL